MLHHNTWNELHTKGIKCIFQAAGGRQGHPKNGRICPQMMELCFHIVSMTVFNKRLETNSGHLQEIHGPKEWTTKRRK
jgi:hypothetical protein